MKRSRSKFVATKPKSPPAATAYLQALPNQVFERIVRNVVAGINGNQCGLRVLPPVSHTLLKRLQDLSLAVLHLHGAQARWALQHRRFAADGRRAWSVHTLNLSGRHVKEVSALAGCLSLHTLNLSHTG